MTTITGRVVPGDQRGRTLGFPTANISITGREDLDGVWAGTVRLPSGAAYPAAVSIGRRETFYSGSAEPLLEAHVIGYTGDLYGLELRVDLDAFLREQLPFRNVQDLIDQMHRDVAHTLVARESWETCGGLGRADAAVSVGGRAAVAAAVADTPR